MCRNGIPGRGESMNKGVDTPMSLVCSEDPAGAPSAQDPSAQYASCDGAAEQLAGGRGVVVKAGRTGCSRPKETGTAWISNATVLWLVSPGIPGKVRDSLAKPRGGSRCGREALVEAVVVNPGRLFPLSRAPQPLPHRRGIMVAAALRVVVETR